MPLKPWLLFTGIATCAAHGGMNTPASWQDQNSELGMSELWRLAGCKNLSLPWDIKSRGCIANWFTNHTFIPGEPTIDVNSPFKTFNFQAGTEDTTKKHPWRAPGSAPVHGPCGVDGRNPRGCPEGNPDSSACMNGGYGHGPDGRTQPGNKKPTNWTIGEVHEVAWGFQANLGGGYQYRLCKKTANKMDLTEECFSKMPLKLHGDKSWVQYFGHNLMRTEIKADRLTTGVLPEGSEWTKNPIPSCAGADGGVFDLLCMDSQFPPPAPGVTGFWGVFNMGIPALGRGRLQDLSIVDKVVLPDNIEPGEYVIQWRWDAELQPMVFNTCGDLVIRAPDTKKEEIRL